MQVRAGTKNSTQHSGLFSGRFEKCCDVFFAFGGGVYKSVDMISCEIVMRSSGGIAAVKGVDNYKLDFHFIWYYTFNINACLLTYADAFFAFGKTGKMWTKLDESAVALY